VRVTSSGSLPIDVEAPYAVFETLPDEQTRVFSVGRYADRVVRDTEGTLRFADKVCIYDSVLIPTSLVYPL
jgi:salicylate 5-hydroxylase small subunit